MILNPNAPPDGYAGLKIIVGNHYGGKLLLSIFN